MEALLFLVLAIGQCQDELVANISTDYTAGIVRPEVALGTKVSVSLVKPYMEYKNVTIVLNDRVRESRENAVLHTYEPSYEIKGIEFGRNYTLGVYVGRMLVYSGKVDFVGSGECERMAELQRKGFAELVGVVVAIVFIFALLKLLRFI